MYHKVKLFASDKSPRRYRYEIGTFENHDAERLYPSLKFWLGLRAPSGNKTFTWINTGLEPMSPAWNTGEPGLPEDKDACVFQSGDRWYDTDCYLGQASVICQYDIGWKFTN